LRHAPAWLAAGLLWCITQLPFAWQLAIGRLLGRVLLAVARKRREIARTNLTLCFPGLSADERRRLLAAHFDSLGIGLWKPP
jgi:KDO2-lipid IV(A) lauroyltransferase